MTHIEIDVSKGTFIVTYSTEKTCKTKTFHSTLLIYLLSEVDITISLENPLKMKNLAHAMRVTVKTEKTVARLIVLYGEKMLSTAFAMSNDAILTLKQKRMVIRHSKKQLISTINLKGSRKCYPFFNA
ncbi:hypothetical protein DEM91_07915 [Prevotella sp. TCVGH]|uniref:hypothetical protein n=1 Tax=Prevotella sp. TCVGH TaxID=2182433 RepID=UPI00201DAAEB|nr:hypothetical protein [Prevotella sp. TCVGH]MCL6748550.1 hypothetical protein [Prevotella sp. TCVGH]